tara:strand:- start:121 stop:234 length:114 start_codon:yes stop_codon:yes gene_type:complete
VKTFKFIIGVTVELTLDGVKLFLSKVENFCKKKEKKK